MTALAQPTPPPRELGWELCSALPVLKTGCVIDWALVQSVTLLAEALGTAEPRRITLRYAVNSTPQDELRPLPAAWGPSYGRYEMFYLTLAALACVLVVSRLTGLDQSLWHDEVFGVVNYVRPGPSGFWLGEYEPNDHLLFNLLAWLTTSVTGLDEVALRAWSVLPGIVAVAALTWWSWERLGPWVAVVVAFLATTSPLYLLLHKEARGYGLMALASVLLLISADRLLTNQGKSLGRWFGFGGAGVLGITTHLAFALGFAAQAAALFVRRKLRAGVLVVAVCVGLASAVAYAPLLDEMVSDLPKYYGGSQSSPDTAAQGRTPTRQPLAWHAPLTGPATLLAPGTEVLVRGTAYGPCDARCYDGIKLILVAPLFLCWVAGGAALWSQGRRALLLILVAAPVMSFLILTLQHGYVAARFVSYTMPPTLVVVAVGAVAIVERLSVNRFVRPLVWAVAGLSAVLMLLQFGRLTLWWNARPFEDMRTVAAIADREGEGPILTNSSRPDGLYYYLGRGRVRVVDPLALERVACSRGAPFVFIYHRYRADPVDLSCLEERGVPPVRVKQRGRGEYVDVYLVDA